MYGQVPFHDDNIVALYDKICTQDLVFPNEQNISSELKDLITKILVKGGLISDGILISIRHSNRSKNDCSQTRMFEFTFYFEKNVLKQCRYLFLDFGY